jgi:hypothetical protein
MLHLCTRSMSEIACYQRLTNQRELGFTFLGIGLPRRA